MLTQLPRSHVSGIGFPAIPNAYASTQLALQYQLESSQWWSPETLLSHQLRQLQTLLEHAAETVPYYQQLLRQHGLTVPREITPEFMQRIPISTRAAVQNAEHLLEAGRLPTGHGTPKFSTTSGSTGRPVRFARTFPVQTLWLAFALRDHLWHKRDFTRKFCTIRWRPRGIAEPPAGDHSDHWGRIVSPIFASGPAAMLNVAAPLEQQLAWLVEEAPEYLLSFPSNLAALAEYCLAQGTSLPGLREVRTIGEGVTDWHRRLIREAWGAPTVDIYTCEEAGYLALQCPVSEHYHAQAENVILEIVDEQGRACAPGQTGQVLVTTLHNYATPLIRYEVGDMAEFGEPCSCGRGLPVIRKIHGRKRNRLRLPSGRSEFPYLGEHGEIEKLTGLQVRQFQCVQNSLEEIEIKLVMERPFTAEEEAMVARRLQDNLGHPFRVVFSFPADIPKSPTGKFEEFISKVV
jgi:phenylacetate-CoA ligase